MTDDKNISEEQLNAFVDNQLDDEERARVLRLIREEKEKSEHLCELRQVKEMISLAYNDLPVSIAAPKMTTSYVKPLLALAASVLIMIGALGGWLSHVWVSEKHIYAANQFDIQKIDGNRILIHINSMDPQRVENVFHLIETILINKADEPVQLEVVANSEALNMLRKGSPYAKQVKSFTKRMDNLSFLACGVAMENARVRENSEIELLPEARRVDAAIDEILRRLKQGWSYVRG